MSLRYMSRTCIRAVQGLKDQNSSKGMIRHPQARTRSESDSSNQFRRISGAVEPMKKAGALDDKKKSRKAEKAENVMHLVCWGPK
ncbi:hypothetical protein Tsubulata_011601 [Turnera subulata]|uniref:Uncharacterized protein n=1 Tax=Turnera subulata TaxID=218843 RepID=A0A9Q0JP07_9ROSI|nr:hypothetical protein Tsubulata_011601 [Turnera subulata]